MRVKCARVAFNQGPLSWQIVHLWCFWAVACKALLEKEPGCVWSASLWLSLDVPLLFSGLGSTFTTFTTNRKYLKRSDLRHVIGRDATNTRILAPVCLCSARYHIHSRTANSTSLSNRATCQLVKEKPLLADKRWPFRWPLHSYRCPFPMIRHRPDRHALWQLPNLQLHEITPAIGDVVLIDFIQDSDLESLRHLPLLKLSR